MSVVTLTQNVITAEVGPPSRLEAEAAMRTLIRWAGDDPTGMASSTPQLD
jgi:hypothetical protein